MKQPVKSPAQLLAPGRALTLSNVAEGAEGLVVSDLARAIAARPKKSAISLAVVCRDGPRMQQLARALEFFAADLPVLQFPAWDCQPYDRVSPHGGVLAQRLTTLARLSRRRLMGFMRGTGRPICGQRDHIVGCVDNSCDGLTWSIVPAKGLRFGESLVWWPARKPVCSPCF